MTTATEKIRPTDLEAGDVFTQYGLAGEFATERVYRDGAIIVVVTDRGECCYSENVRDLVVVRKAEQGPKFYGLLARPYFPESTQPAGETVVENYRTDRQMHDGRKVHAVLRYDRALSADEVTFYALHEIADFEG